MKYEGIIKKSRTLDFAMLLAVMAPVESNFHLIQNQLGDNYGLVFFVISGVVAYLRFKTKGQVGDK